MGRKKVVAESSTRPKRTARDLSPEALHRRIVSLRTALQMCGVDGEVDKATIEELAEETCLGPFRVPPRARS
jgi:hypothetical protein